MLKIILAIPSTVVVLAVLGGCGGGGSGGTDADAAGDGAVEPDMAADPDAAEDDGGADPEADMPHETVEDDAGTDPDGDPPSDVCPAGPICEAAGGRCFYIAPVPGSGSGSFDDPFGFDDLPRSDTPYCELGSAAIEAVQPGDVLYFRAGRYELQGCPGDYYAVGYLRPAVSGLPEAPITFSAYPCEQVEVAMVGGGQPAFGDDGRDHLRVAGFTVEGGLGRFMGTGGEIAYNEIRGTHVETGDNHDGIRIEGAAGTWVHHNVIHGVTGLSPNSAGIKLYDTTEIVVENNYIHGNTAGIFDKDSGIRNTYRGNLITGNTDAQWYGNNQDQIASPRIYENVVDGGIELHSLTDGAEVHDNLVRGDMLAGAWAGDTWNTHLWNNVVISHAGQVTAYREPQNPYTGEEPSPHLRYMDFNVYDAPPVYAFGEYSASPATFDLAGMQAMGFEIGSQVATGVYIDEISYVLAAAWTTAGRYGDPVGPDDVAAILDLGRYGPDARPVPY